MKIIKTIKTFDIVAQPAFGCATITHTMSILPPKNVIRKKKIENLLSIFDKSSK